MDNTYVVKEGDNLSEILKKETGDGSYEQFIKVAQANGLDNPDKIYVGQKIDLSSVAQQKRETLGSTAGASEIATPSSDDITKDIILDKNFEENMMTKLDMNSEKPQTNTSKNLNSSEQAILSSNEKKSQANVSKVAKTFQTNTFATKQAVSSIDKSNTQNNVNLDSSNNYYITQSLYEICFPNYVKGFKTKNNYFWFTVKENAGEEFVNVNNCVKNCCADLENIIGDLKELKRDMGENTGTLTEIENIINGIQKRKEELLQKNKELISACEEVVQYVYKNKSSKANEAAKIATTIAQIKI